MRQLATVRTVKELIPIEGADRIELAKVDGWQCVVKKGDFKVGDDAIYFEIDSILPADDERFAFLEQRKYRIKSMKLRGALSQGLLMPLSILTQDERVRYEQGVIDIIAGRDPESLTDILRVQKYEPPVPIAGQQKGNFPTHLVPKTDQERIQNIPETLAGTNFAMYEITEKLDGTSCTFFYFSKPGILVPQDGAQLRGERNPRWGACSRNWEMDLQDDNVYAKLWRELELHSKLADLDRNLAIQGEIIGPRIQGNRYQRAKQEFYVFDVFDIDKQEYLGFWPRWDLVRDLGLLHVPVLQDEIIDRIGGGDVHALVDIEPTLDMLLRFADGESMLHKTKREGLVFKRNDGQFSFKAISNKFLLKAGE